MMDIVLISKEVEMLVVHREAIFISQDGGGTRRIVLLFARIEAKSKISLVKGPHLKETYCTEFVFGVRREKVLLMLKTPRAD